jgi:hypothetical protein
MENPTAFFTTKSAKRTKKDRDWRHVILMVFVLFVRFVVSTSGSRIAYTHRVFASWRR